MDYEALEADKLQQELEQLEQQREKLRQALERKKQQKKQEIADQVKALIAESGYEVDDICALVLGSRRYRAVKRTVSRERRHYRRFADPKHPERVYSRGPLPWWLREMMEKEGYDVNDKEAREKFKTSYLRLLEG